MKNFLIKTPICYAIIGLISVFQILFFITPKKISADDRCGPGYTCWEKAGGSSSLYSWCELSPTGQYCQGGGVYDATCTCDGSSNCTCDLGPGTTCENPIETGPIYECLIGDVQCSLDAPREEQCPPTQTDPYAVYGDSCVFSGEFGNVCPSPTGSSHIGCCYSESSSPDPINPPQPSPVTTLTADIKANGSDTFITVSGPYTISWQATGATSCTLNGVLSNFGGNSVYSNGPGNYAYTYRCTNGSNTVTDTVAVEVDCGTIIADIKANGSDSDITVFDDYIMIWTSTNADDCTLNGNMVTLSGGHLETADLNGDFTYILNCENYCGDTDTDDVAVTVNLCGNDICSGFENCLSCEADCGACPNQWFQAWGGHLFAGLSTGNAITSMVSDAATYPYLMGQDAAGHALSDGFPITGGGYISADGRISARTENTYIVGSTTTRLHENYSYFYSRYSLGFSPDDYFCLTSGDALEPTTIQETYFHSGDLTIQNPWDITSGESYVIFVDGNLNLTDPGNLGQLITVQEGGFLAFIVSGDINVDETVGNTNPADSMPNIAGLYVADGTITIEGAASPPDKRFIGEGSFIGWTDVILERDLADDNAFYPAETFIYRPDFVTYTPDQMKRSQRIWQETN